MKQKGEVENAELPDASRVGEKRQKTIITIENRGSHGVWSVDHYLRMGTMEHSITGRDGKMSRHFLVVTWIGRMKRRGERRSGNGSVGAISMSLMMFRLTPM